jgi:histidine phosphotransfer protein HptB
MIDWARVTNLRDEIGEENFDEIVALFLEEADGAVGDLTQGLDLSELGTALHSLKGSALNLGFESLAQLCGAAELQATSGIQPDIEGIVAAYARSRSAFGNGQPMAAA